MMAAGVYPKFLFYMHRGRFTKTDIQVDICRPPSWLTTAFGKRGKNAASWAVGALAPSLFAGYGAPPAAPVTVWPFSTLDAT